MKHLFAAGPVVILLSMALGSFVALIMPVTWDAVRTQYDYAHPVWLAESATLVRRDGMTATVRLVGEKHRMCDLLRTWAQATYPDRPATDAYVQRPNGATVGYLNRPLGRQDLGEFLIAPIPHDATGIAIHVEHDCAGRTVVSSLGRVAFDGSAR